MADVDLELGMEGDHQLFVCLFVCVFVNEKVWFSFTSETSDRGQLRDS